MLINNKPKNMLFKSLMNCKVVFKQDASVIISFQSLFTIFIELYIELLNYTYF